MTKTRQRDRARRRQETVRREVAPPTGPTETFTINFTGSDVFVEYKGLRIAKRGHPDTEHAGTWISLEPGYVVYSDENHDHITIEYNGVKVQ
jgi:hypothetical protein